MKNWEFISNPPFDVCLPIEGYSADWELLKQQHPFGTILTGKIFARTYFGVFFDASQ